MYEECAISVTEEQDLLPMREAAAPHDKLTILAPCISSLVFVNIASFSSNFSVILKNGISCFSFDLFAGYGSHSLDGMGVSPLAMMGMHEQYPWMKEKKSSRKNQMAGRTTLKIQKYQLQKYQQGCFTFITFACILTARAALHSQVVG